MSSAADTNREHAKSELFVWFTYRLLAQLASVGGALVCQRLGSHAGANAAAFVAVFSCVVCGGGAVAARAAAAAAAAAGVLEVKSLHLC